MPSLTKPIHHAYRLIVLLCMFVAVTSWADPFSNTANTQSSLSLQTTFLPVAEAYQFSGDINQDQLTLHWTIAPGYYLYQERFKVTEVTATDLKGPLPLVFEAGVRRYDDYYEKELTVYYNQTRTMVRLPTASEPFTLAVESQGCADAGLCYPPRTDYIKVDPLAGTVSTTDKPLPAATKPPGSKPAGSFPLMLLFALLGGLILNLMPCVFPVLSIKSLSLASSGLSTRKRHHHGLAYTAGSVTTFIIIALVLLILRSGGEALGWGFQLQSPGFIVFLIYLFFLLGLSFSGYFEAGAQLMNIGQGHIKGSGLKQSFFTGALACVVASPCSAPFMGTALGVALTLSTPGALLIFAFLGLGMALPFLLLSWAPALANRLPKPGPWMVTLKEFLAFPLYLTCAWLLWVLGRQTSVDALIATVVGLVLLAFAIWAYKYPTKSAKVITAFLLLLAILAGSKALGPKERHTLWEPYSPQRLESLLQQGQPVFINLTADWCITCLANERIALRSTTFAEALIRENITYLKGDWTHQDPDITQLLTENGRSGVPLYLFYPRGTRDPVILPQLLTPATVINTFSGKNP